MENAILAFFGLVLLILIGLVIRYWKELGEFIADVRTEMSKVTWPAQQDVINATTLVFVVTIVLTLMVWVVDWMLGHGMTFLFKTFS